MTREYACYRPGFPSAAFGAFLGIVTAGDRHEAARLGRHQFGVEVVVMWHRPQGPRKREPVLYRAMSLEEVQMARALERCCSFMPATWSKRFARDVGAQARAQEPKITAKQAEALRRLTHTYRRQIPAEIVAYAGIFAAEGTR